MFVVHGNGESRFYKFRSRRIDAQQPSFYTRLENVSCSPYRVPVARLAAAQAAIEEKRKAAKPAKKK